MPEPRNPRRPGGRHFAGLCVGAWVALAATIPAAAGPLYDEAGDPARRSIVDLAHQRMATCTAFFLIAAEATPPTAANRAALQRLDQAAGGLIDAMLKLRDEAVTRARVEAERQWLMLSIDGSLAGYPRLHEALAGPCAGIAADPQGHVDGLLAGKSPDGPPPR